jgi:hypothetical protein
LRDNRVPLPNVVFFADCIDLLARKSVAAGSSATHERDAARYECDTRSECRNTAPRHNSLCAARDELAMAAPVPPPAR